MLPIFRAEDAAGASLPFALLYTYAAGTTTPLTTYQDAAGTIPNSNPVICDANGLAVVFLTTGVAYKFSLTDQYGTVQPKYPQDNLVGGATGATGAPGSIWRNGAGVPSNSVGIDGDFYLNTSNGDVYKRSGGVYAVIANIIGPAGSSKNAILNGSFYLGLSPWVTSGAIAPTLGTGSTALLGSAQEYAAQNIAVAVTSVGSISQSFSIGTPVGSQILKFNTAAYYEAGGVSASIANTGYAKVYVYNAASGIETLVGTINTTAISTTPTWAPNSIDITAQMPVAGDYGVRFEIQAYTDNTAGTPGLKGTISAVDDVTLIISTGGTAGPTGPTGPAGPGVGLGNILTNSNITGGTYSTGSLTPVMVGKGSQIRFTPSLSTRVFINFKAEVSNNIAADVAFIQIAYGTGSAPASGAALPGGASWVGGASPCIARITSNVGGQHVDASITYIVTGLTPLTNYWFDPAIYVFSNTGSIYAGGMNVTIFEL
jgi:hypothetical protein